MAQLAVRVTPRSARPGIGEWIEDADGRPLLEVRVAAAPADGSANEEVVRRLAKALGVARSAVRLRAGAAARVKRFEIALDEETLRARLPAAS